MDSTTTTMTLIDLFMIGGIFMWPLLVFSIITVALILERAIFFIYYNLNLKGLSKNVLDVLKNKDINKAISYCEKAPKRQIGAKVILEGLKVSKYGEDMMEKVINAEAAEMITKLENGFDILTAMGSLSPLTGFLGTVSGMISAFSAIANATDVNAQLVAGGIFEALITTVYGLIIAIIAISGYSVLAHIVDKFANDIESISTDVITTIIINNENVINENIIKDEKNDEKNEDENKQFIV